MAKWTKAAWDLGMLAGAGAFTFGLYLAWHPLGFIAGGLLLGAVCFFSGYDQQRRGTLERLRNGGRS